MRPNARVGFYSQGINQDSRPSGRQVDQSLSWLWELVDVLAPSIYPHGREPPALATATKEQHAAKEQEQRRRREAAAELDPRRRGWRK